jgi:hypothetical protein
MSGQSFVSVCRVSFCGHWSYIVMDMWNVVSSYRGIWLSLWIFWRFPSFSKRSLRRCLYRPFQQNRVESSNLNPTEWPRRTPDKTVYVIWPQYTHTTVWIYVSVNRIRHIWVHSIRIWILLIVRVRSNKIMRLFVAYVHAWCQYPYRQ